MKKWVHYIEIFVDRSIPFTLLLLLLIIIEEIFFHETMVKYHRIVQILDWLIIAIFAVDLVFKYLRIRDLPRFLRASWIEIVAIFPFFLIFRFFDGIAGLFGVGEVAVTETQKIIHLGAEVEREVGSVVKEVSRTERLSRFLRPLSRSVRFLKLENPKVREETKRELENAELKTEHLIKDVEKLPRYVKAALFYEKAGISYKHHKGKLNKRIKPGEEQ